MDVIRFENNIITIYAAVCTVIIIVAAISSWIQKRRLEREKKNKKNNKLTERHIVKIIEDTILRNKITGELDAHKISLQIVNQLIEERLWKKE